MKQISVLLALCLFGLSAGKDVPSLFSKCKKNDENLSKCLTESVNKGYPELVKADSSWEAIHIDDINDEVVNLVRGTITNGTLEGLQDAKFIDIQVDFKKKVINVIFSCPRLSIIGNSEVDGKILGLKFIEESYVNITYTGGVYNYRFKYDLQVKELEDYIKIVKNELVYTIEGLNVNFESDETERSARNSKLINDNWKLLNLLTSSTMGRVFSSIFTTRLSQFFEEIPFDNLFE